MFESGLRTQSATNAPEGIIFVLEIQYLFKHFV